MKYIITGQWDGDPIWREKSIAEQLLEELNKNESIKHKSNNKSQGNRKV